MAITKTIKFVTTLFRARLKLLDNQNNIKYYTECCERMQTTHPNN